MSITGFAAKPGTAVLPTCSQDLPEPVRAALGGMVVADRPQSSLYRPGVQRAKRGWKVAQGRDLRDPEVAVGSAATEAVDPDGAKACRHGSVYVSGEAVSDHDRLSAVTVQLCERMSEDRRVGLADPDFRRD